MSDRQDVRPEVHALRLLRRTYLRRALRTLIGLECLAIVVWAAYSMTVEKVYDSDTLVWQRLDAATGPGFLVILAALAVTIAGLVVAGRLGAEGPLARRLAPVGSRAVVPGIRTSTGKLEALRGRLRRQGYVSAVAVVMFLLFAPLAVLTAADTVPAWRANHGHGGTVFTIDADTDIEKTAGSLRGRYPLVSYYVSTPEGRAIAQSGHPEVGQSWVVRDDLLGNPSAYLIGGYDYVLTGFLFLLSGALTVVALGAQAEQMRGERKLRRAVDRHGRHHLVDDITALAAGGRAELLFDGAVVGILTLPETDARDVRRRLILGRIAIGAGAVVVLGGLGVLLVLQQLAIFAAVP